MNAVHLRRIDDDAEHAPLLSPRHAAGFIRRGFARAGNGDALAQKGAALPSILTTRHLQPQHSRNMRRVRRGGVTPNFCVVRMTRFSLKFRAFSQTALSRIE